MNNAPLPESFEQFTPDNKQFALAKEEINAGYFLTFGVCGRIHIDDARQVMRDVYVQNELLEDALFNDQTSPAGKLYHKLLDEEVKNLVKSAFDDYGVIPEEWLSENQRYVRRRA